MINEYMINKKYLKKCFDKTKNIKPKHNLTPEQMDELNERMIC